MFCHFRAASLNKYFSLSNAFSASQIKPGLRLEFCNFRVFFLSLAQARRSGISPSTAHSLAKFYFLCVNRVEKVFRSISRVICHQERSKDKFEGDEDEENARFKEIQAMNRSHGDVYRHSAQFGSTSLSQRVNW